MHEVLWNNELWIQFVNNDEKMTCNVLGVLSDLINEETTWISYLEIKKKPRAR